MELTEKELETKTYRYFIIYLLKELPVGATFSPSDLHITILPWFALETDEKAFTDWFYKHFDSFNAFEATIGEPKMYGPKHDVPVNIVEPKAKFMGLHKLALSWFGAIGARWAERDPYVGNDYVPHIAQRRGFVLTEGDTMHISHIVLVKAKRQEDHIRYVAAKAQLNEK